MNMPTPIALLVCTSSNMSRWPPEKPRQLANTISGRPSWLRSWIAWAVLWALSGYQTPPAWSIVNIEIGRCTAVWAFL